MDFPIVIIGFASPEMIFNNHLAKLKQIPLEGEDESFAGGRAGEPEEISPTLQV